MLSAAGFEKLKQNLADVQNNINDACRNAGRNPDEVRLVAVTKYTSIDAVRALLQLGVVDLGENRPQQLAERALLLGAASAGLPAPDAPNPETPRWHMIGHLQRNKVKSLLQHTKIVHSVDSVRLAEELEKQAAKLDLVVDAFIEINVAAEESKSGADPADLQPITQTLQNCPHIAPRGLMTMAPYDPDPEQARPYFARLREIRDDLIRRGAVAPTCEHLSMGMTVDYAVAVEEGATFIRIGSALFEGVD